jgi:hypothetical protein
VALAAGGGRVAWRGGEAAAPRAQSVAAAGEPTRRGVDAGAAGGALAADDRAAGAATPPAIARGRAEPSADDTRRREPASRSGVAVALDAPQVALGAGLAVAGHDPGGPRRLELWRIAGSRAARIALGASRADGSLAFPPIVLPAGPVELVAAPRGAGPRGPGASAPALVARDPAVPQLSQAEPGLVRVEPAEPAGDVLLAGAAGAITRVAVRADRDGRAAPIDLPLPRPGELLRVAHELPDGRRSPWRSVASLTEPEKEFPHVEEDPDDRR